MHNNHLSSERFIEIDGREDQLTQSEIDHMAVCDYCLEGILSGEDPDIYERRKCDRNKVPFVSKRPK